MFWKRRRKRRGTATLVRMADGGWIYRLDPPYAGSELVHVRPIVHDSRDTCEGIYFVTHVLYPCDEDGEVVDWFEGFSTLECAWALAADRQALWVASKYGVTRVTWPEFARRATLDRPEG